MKSKNDRLESLFKKWEQAHENEPEESLKKTISGKYITKAHFRRDGIIDEAIFSQEKRKVLFISNEANDDEYSAKNGIIKTNNLIDYQNYAKSGYDDWKGKMRERTSEMYKIAAGIPRNAISNSDAALHYAVMDLNKRGGTSSIDKGLHIQAYCRYYKDFIKKEIEIIDPDIIVWLGTKTYDMEIPSILGAYGPAKRKSFRINNKVVPIIRMWHTSYTYGNRYVKPLAGYDGINGSLCAKLKMEMKKYNLNRE